MKNYQIQFKDGKTEYVSGETYFQILKDSGDPLIDSFIINNNRFLFKDIKRMVEPQEEASGFDIAKLIKNRTPEKRLKAIEAIAKGLKDFIDSDRYQNTEEPLNLLELMRKTYSEAKLELNN